MAKKGNNNMVKENKEILVEMWVDYMCPLCYIGKVNIESAIKNSNYKEEVRLVFRPFQLFPNAPLNTQRNYYEYTSLTHNGIPVDYIKNANRSVVELAKSIGLNYDLDNLIPTNTTDALRITLYAQEKGKANELSAKIYRSYFEEARDIADPETLIALGVEAGLIADKISEVIKAGLYRTELEASRLIGEKIGIRGTPFFNFNNEFSVSGIRPKEDLVSIINRICIEEGNADSLGIIEGQSCDISGKCQ